MNLIIGRFGREILPPEEAKSKAMRAGREIVASDTNRRAADAYAGAFGNLGAQYETCYAALVAARAELAEAMESEVAQ